jgi:hypothetical protein
MLSGLFRSQQSTSVGGPKGSLNDAYKMESNPNYNAAYLAHRLGQEPSNLKVGLDVETTDRFKPMGKGPLDERDKDANDVAKKIAYYQSVSKGVESEAEECLKKEFKAWLAGRHSDNENPQKYRNIPGRLERKDARGNKLDDWHATWWGRKGLTHLPGVQDYLRNDLINATEEDYKMNMLAQFGPQNLNEAWAYFKYWVKGHPVGPESCLQPEFDETRSEPNSTIAMAQSTATDIQRREGKPKAEIDKVATIKRAAEILNRTDMLVPWLDNVQDEDRFTKKAGMLGQERDSKYVEPGVELPKKPDYNYVRQVQDYKRRRKFEEEELARANMGLGEDDWKDALEKTMTSRNNGRRDKEQTPQLKLPRRDLEEERRETEKITQERLAAEAIARDNSNISKRFEVRSPLKLRSQPKRVLKVIRSDAERAQAATIQKDRIDQETRIAELQEKERDRILKESADYQARLDAYNEELRKQQSILEAANRIRDAELLALQKIVEEPLAPFSPPLTQPIPKISSPPPGRPRRFVERGRAKPDVGMAMPIKTEGPPPPAPPPPPPVPVFSPPLTQPPPQAPTDKIEEGPPSQPPPRPPLFTPRPGGYTLVPFGEPPSPPRPPLFTPRPEGYTLVPSGEPRSRSRSRSPPPPQPPPVPVFSPPLTLPRPQAPDVPDDDSTGTQTPSGSPKRQSPKKSASAEQMRLLRSKAQAQAGFAARQEKLRILREREAEKKMELTLFGTYGAPNRAIKRNLQGVSIARAREIEKQIERDYMFAVEAARQEYLFALELEQLSEAELIQQARRDETTRNFYTKVKQEIAPSLPRVPKEELALRDEINKLPLSEQQRAAKENAAAALQRQIDNLDVKIKTEYEKFTAIQYAKARTQPGNRKIQANIDLLEDLTKEKEAYNKLQRMVNIIDLTKLDVSSSEEPHMDVIRAAKQAVGREEVMFVGEKTAAQAAADKKAATPVMELSDDEEVVVRKVKEEGSTSQRQPGDTFLILKEWDKFSKADQDFYTKSLFYDVHQDTNLFNFVALEAGVHGTKMNLMSTAVEYDVNPTELQYRRLLMAYMIDQAGSIERFRAMTEADLQSLIDTPEARSLLENYEAPIHLPDSLMGDAGDDVFDVIINKKMNREKLEARKRGEADDYDRDFEVVKRKIYEIADRRRGNHFYRKQLTVKLADYDSSGL